MYKYNWGMCVFDLFCVVEGSVVRGFYNYSVVFLSVIVWGLGVDWIWEYGKYLESFLGDLCFCGSG